MVETCNINIALERSNPSSSYAGMLGKIDAHILDLGAKDDFSRFLELSEISFNNKLAVEISDFDISFFEEQEELAVEIEPKVEKNGTEIPFSPIFLMPTETQNTIEPKVQFETEELRLKALSVRQSTSQDTSLKSLLPKDSSPILVKDFKSDQKPLDFGLSKMSTPMLQVLQTQDEPSQDISDDFLPRTDLVTSGISTFSQSSDTPSVERQTFKPIEVSSMTITPKGKDMLEIQLYPEFLGKVDVKISLDHSSGNVQASITPESLEGYQSILKSHAQLKESIVEHLKNDTKKEGGLISTVEIRVHEPPSTKTDLSSFQQSFSSQNQFSQSGQKQHHHSHPAFTTNYSRAAEYIQEAPIPVLNENKRIDLAV